MKIPKRLPKGLAAKLKGEQKRGNKLLSLQMFRLRGKACFMATLTDGEFFIISIDGELSYDFETGKIEETVSRHVRSIDTYRKVVLASGKSCGLSWKTFAASRTLPSTLTARTRISTARTGRERPRSPMRSAGS